MATQNIQVQINTAVESAESARSLGQLRRSLLDIQNLQAQIGDESSDEFQRLSRAAQQATGRLAGTREALGDIQDRVRTLDGSPVERMTNSFQLLREAIFNLDFDKLKIALNGLKASLLTNPIFLIGAAIAAAAVALTAILGSLGLLQPILDSVGKLFKAIGDEIKRFTDFLGITINREKEAAKIVLETYEMRKKALEEEAAIRRQIYDLSKNLSDAELKDLEAGTGIRLGQIKTIEQAEIASIKAQYDNNGKAIQELERLKREVEAKNQRLDKETSDKLAALWENDKILWDKLQVSKAAAAAAANKAIVDLEKQLSGLTIQNMTNERSRSKAMIEAERAETLAAFDEKVKQIEAEGKTFENAAKLRAAINQRFNQQINEVNQKFRQEDIKNRLTDLEESFELERLQTEDGTEERLKIEAEYRDAKIEFLRQYRVQLGLSNTQIKIIEEKFADELKAINKSVRDADLNAFEQDWALKIQREKEGSVARLQVEKDYLTEKMTYYSKNYEQLGMSEVEYSQFVLRTQNQIGGLIKEIAGQWNFDVGTLITQTNLERQMSDLATMLGSPQALTPWRNYVQQVADLIIAEDPIGELRKLANESFFVDEEQLNDALRSAQLKAQEISKEFYRQEQGALKLSLNNLKIYTDVSQNYMSTIASQISQTFAFGQLTEATNEYYDNLQQLQFETAQQQQQLAKSQYADYVQQQEDQYKTAVDTVNRIADEQMLVDIGNTDRLLQIEADRKMQLALIDDAYKLSREGQEQIHNDALTAMRADAANKSLQIEDERARALREIQNRENQERLALSATALKGLQALTGMFFKDRSKMSKDLTKEEEKQLRAQFEVQKYYNAGLAAINGIQSILAITSIPDPTLGIQQAIRIAAQVALNVASVAGILSQSYNGPVASVATGAGSLPTPSIPTTGLGGGQQEVTPPPVFTPANFIGIGQNQPMNQGMVQNPNRVYVLESDITATQRRVSVIEERARFT